ncbi:MAG: hypothetical protein Q8O94_01485 [bacterium]|nr:hypothetical protein [bacterium]
MRKLFAVVLFVVFVAGCGSYGQVMKERVYLKNGEPMMFYQPTGPPMPMVWEDMPDGTRVPMPLLPKRE